MKKKQQKTREQPKKEIKTPFNYKHTGITVFVIICCTFICLYPSVKNGFVNWDDQVYVYENSSLQQKHTSLKEIFTTPVALNYHPLTMLSLAFNYRMCEPKNNQWAGIDPAPFHWTNLMLHLLNTLLVFVFIYLLTGMSDGGQGRGEGNAQLITAGITALFFGIHPMHVESVVWVSERKDVLYTFFYLSALVVYLKYISTQSSIFNLQFSIVFLLFILSCLSKAMAVTLPVLLLLIDYFTGRKFTWKVIMEKFPFFIVSVVVGLVAFHIQSGGGVMGEMKVFSGFQRFLFASYGFMVYIAKLFVPVNLSAFYPYPVPDEHSAQLPFLFYLAPFMVAAVFVAAFLLWKKSTPIPLFPYTLIPSLRFGLLFYLITVALVLQFITVGSALLADRYVYMSYIGLFFIIGSISANVFNQGSSVVKTVLAFSLVVYTFILCAGSYNRTQVWKDGITLWTDAIAKSPATAMVYNNRAIAKTELKDFRGAVEDYNKALEADSTYAFGYSNRANAKLKTEDYAGALEDCNKALILNPAYSNALFNRGNAEFMLKKYTEALRDYNEALRLNPLKYDALYNRGVIKNDILKDYSGAMEDYTQAIRLSPNNYTYYFNRANSKFLTDDFEGAIKDLTKVIMLKPQISDGYYWRAVNESKLQRKEEACADYQKAIELGDKDAKDDWEKVCR